MKSFEDKLELKLRGRRLVRTISNILRLSGLQFSFLPISKGEDFLNSLVFFTLLCLLRQNFVIY